MCRRGVIRRRLAAVRLIGALILALGSAWGLTGGFLSAAPAPVSALETSVTGADASAPRSRFLFSEASPQRQVASLAAADQAVVRSRLVSLNLDWLAERGGQAQVTADPAKLVELNLFPDVFLLARLDRLEVRSPTQYSWIGHVSGVGDSHVFLVVEQGVLSGSVYLPSATYEVRYAGDGLHTIQEVNIQQVNPGAVPADDAPVIVPNSGEPPPANPTDSGELFDVLVVYTPAARQLMGGTDAMVADINRDIAETNTAFANSGVLPRLRLVRTAEIAYNEGPSLSLNLARLQNSADGYMDEVHPLRDSVGADLVNLRVVQAFAISGAGLTYEMNGVDAGFAPLAFSVTGIGQVFGIPPAAKLRHLLGHNMGCHHAPQETSTDLVVPGIGAFAYSRAYWSPTSPFFSTIMASAGGSILHYSSPTHFYQGRVTGTAGQDNARSINEVAITVANFRQERIASTRPGPPRNLTARVEGSLVTLEWGIPTTGGLPSSYIVQAGWEPGESNVFNGGVGNLRSVSTPVDDGYYYIRVRARNAAGVSDPSNEAVADVCTSPPDPPVGLSSTVNGSSVTLRWRVSIFGCRPTSFRVEAGVAPGRSDLVTEVTEATFTAAPVAPGIYYARVRAFNRYGYSNPSGEIQVFVFP